MLGIMIVDDDEILLNGLKSAFDWKSMGIEVIAAVNDGDRALQLLREIDCDILLTDIKMNKMDGISLVREVTRLYPDVSVLIMSAYDDFTYAQEACKLGVADYFLKPLDIRQMRETMQRIVSSIQAQRTHQNRIRDINAMIEANRSSLISTLLEEIIAGTISETDYLARKRRLQIPDAKEWILVENAVNLAPDSEKYIQKQAAEAAGVFYLSHHNKHLFAVPVDGNLKEEIERLRTCLEQQSGASAHLIISSPVEDITKLRGAYECIKKLREYRYAALKGKDIDPEYVSSLSTMEKNTNFRLNHEIFDNTMRMGKQACASLVEEIREAVKNTGGASQHWFTIYLGMIIGYLMDEATFNDLQRDSLLEMQQQALAEGTLDGAIHILKEKLMQMCEEFYRSDCAGNQEMISRAKRYIHQNYANPELRIGDVAYHVGMSISHFGAMFRKYTGESFTNYLIRTRIEQAEKLILNTECRSYEIAQKVGYENPAYFSSVFRRVTGCTISRFRETKGKGESGS